MDCKLPLNVTTVVKSGKLVIPFGGSGGVPPTCASYREPYSSF